MNGTSRLSRAVAASAIASLALAFGTLTAQAEEASSVKTLYPLHGVSIDIGSKHVVGYYVARGDSCNLTVLMSDKSASDDVPASSAARLQHVIVANGTTRIDTAEGESLELACQPQASALTVRVLKQVASYEAGK